MSILRTIGKVIAVARIGRFLIHTPVARRFLARLAVAIALTVLTCILAAVLVAFSFYGLFEILLSNGMEPLAAVVTVGSIAVLATAGLAAWTIHKWRHLGDLPQLFSEDSFFGRQPLIGRAGQVAGAFVEGLLERRHR